jgi:hypothetical protein
VRLRRRPSIYEHVRRHLLPGGGLAEEGETLPDEERSRETISFAPGALEGTFVRYWGGADVAEARAEELHEAVVALADQPGSAARRRVVELAREVDVRTSVDPLIERLAAEPPADLDRLHAELVQLLVGGERREEVKLAIALLGPFGYRPDTELFRTLAYHEEFTLYAAIALANAVDDPVAEWLALLPHLSGWGKTELSELLLREPNEDVCSHLLRHGQSIGNALLLATECRLHEALATDNVDEELLDGARGIFDALTGSFDSPDTLLDWPHAGPATVRLLELLEPRTDLLGDFLLADQIRNLLTEPSAEDDAALDEAIADLGGDPDAFEPEPPHEEQLRTAGFDDDRLARALELCEAILGRPEWRPRAKAALHADDERSRGEAIEVAKRLGLPLRAYLVEQIERRPTESYLWQELVAGADEERIDEAIALAERVLDLDAVATGPALDLIGPPPEEGPHQALEFVLQELPRFPGRGVRLLAPALRSPVIRERLVALGALEKWDREAVPPELARRVEETATRDPDEYVRRAARAVARGEPIPDRDESGDY